MDVPAHFEPNGTRATPFPSAAAPRCTRSPTRRHPHMATVVDQVRATVALLGVR